MVMAVDEWSTYPSVPHTASINGFADPIYEDLPECARQCVELSTKNTPCPYWDTGCFCVMPQWSGIVGSCIAESCRGDEVAKATSLAYSLCTKVGADVWNMPSSVLSLLSLAAGSAHEAPSTTKDATWGKTEVVSSVLATARTEDKTRSGGPTSTSSGNGAGSAVAGAAAFVVMVVGFFA